MQLYEKGLKALDLLICATAFGFLFHGGVSCHTCPLDAECNHRSYF